jgi:putative colanic acid biosynthesis UDP-glucose lipid carrier transferase
VKLSGSRGPVFFKQMRLGKDNEEFVCWKFRSMRMNVEADSKQATKNDPSCHGKWARFLRKSNLDEMPQFINVLFGHMSIVGPRPHPLAAERPIPRHHRQVHGAHFVRPGITGLGPGERVPWRDPHPGTDGKAAWNWMCGTWRTGRSAWTCGSW